MVVVRYRVLCAYIDKCNGTVVDDEREFDSYSEADSFAYDYVDRKPYGRALLSIGTDHNGYVNSYVYYFVFGWTLESPHVERTELGMWENMFNPTYP